MANSLSAAAAAAATHFLRRNPQSPSCATPKPIRAKIAGDEKKKTLLRSRLTTLLNPAAAVAIAATMVAAPMTAVAAEIEKAALFDFNLTLPAIALEFVLLMVALDKIYFTPLGKFMDDRDAAIRAQLGDVKDTSEEVKQMEEQAAAVMKAARAEISAALNQMKKETTVELEQQLVDGKKKVEGELAEALAALEQQKEETLNALDSQIKALSDEIVSKTNSWEKNSTTNCCFRSCGCPLEDLMGNPLQQPPMNLCSILQSAIPSSTASSKEEQPMEAICSSAQPPQSTEFSIKA